MAFSFHLTLSFSIGRPEHHSKRRVQQKGQSERPSNDATPTASTKRQTEHIGDGESLRLLQLAQTTAYSRPTRAKESAPFSIISLGEDPFLDAQTTDLQGRYSSSSGGGTSLEHLSVMRPTPLNASLDENEVTCGWGEAGEAGKAFSVGSQSIINGAVETGAMDGDRATQRSGQRSRRVSSGQIELVGERDGRDLARGSGEERDRSDEEFGGGDWQEVDSSGSV